jgi:RHS repeat-associated protein
MIEGRPLPTNVYRPGQQAPQALQAAAFTPNFAPAVPDFASMAAGLNNDPDLIYRYVANNIQYLPTYGSQKGGLTCMIDRVGNSFDQAALMVALLTAAGKTAHFMFGQLKLTQAQAASWLGTDPTNIWAASNLLANGGVPVNVVWDAPSSSYFLTLSHVWVKVDITGSGNWYVFDPAFKQHTITAGIDVATAMGWNQTNFTNAALSGSTVTADYFQNVNQANISSQIATMSTNLTNWINANKPAASIDDILGKKTINQVTGALRQTTLPYQDSSVTPTEWTAIPNSYKTTFNIQYDTINQTFYSEDISSKTLTLFFNASMQAELRLGGTLLATSTAQGVGTWNSALFTVTHPYANTWANQSFWQRVWAGSSYLIAQAWGNTSKEMAFLHQKLLKDNQLAGVADADPTVLGQSLSVLWHNWNAQKTILFGQLGRMNKCSTVLHHQLGMVGQGVGPFTDLGGIVWSTSAIDNDYTRVKNTDTIIALRGIGLESNCINQVPGVTGVSSDTVILNANAAGQQLFFATSANWATVRPQLINYATSDLDNLTNWYINAGWTLLIHKNGQTNQNSYTGYGIYGISPNGGAVGLINGMIHGGSSDQPYTAILFNQEAGGGDTSGGAINGAYQAGGNNSQPSNLTRVEVGKKTEHHVDFVVDKNTGHNVYRHTDYVIGGTPWPYSLPFTRFYDSSNIGETDLMGPGWRHNYMITCEINNNASWPALASGSSGAAAGATNIVHGMLATLLGVGGSNTAFMLTVVAVNDASQALVNSTITIRDGDRKYIFTKMRDGTFVSPAGVSMALAYSVDHYVMQSFDGVKYIFTNWAANKTKISQIVFPFGVTVSFTYQLNPDQRLISVSNNVGRSLTFNYKNTAGLLFWLESIDAGAPGAVRLNYNVNVAPNNVYLASFTDCMGNLTSYTYDSKQRMTAYSRPNGGPYSVTYDAQDRVITKSDPGTGLAQFLYGDRTITYTGGPDTVITTFDASGQPLTINENGDITTMTYDSLNRLATKTTPIGEIIVYTYDVWNRATNVVNGDKSETFQFYDSLTLHPDLWTSHTDARGNTWSRTYDPTSLRLLSETSPAVGGQTPTKSWAYNSYGLMSSATDATGIVTTYGYLVGNSSEVTQIVHDAGTGRLNLTTNFSYDNQGHKISETNPRGFTRTFNPDLEGRVLSTTETAPFSYQTAFGYDLIGNLLTVSKQVTSTPTWQTTTTVYDPANNPYTVTDALNNVTTYGYDLFGNLLSTKDAENRLRQYAYTGNHYLLSITDANGVLEEQRVVQPGGLVTQIKDAKNNATNYVYDGHGRRTKATYPDSTYETWTYDLNDNVTQFRARDGNTITYVLDALNRVTSKTPTGQAVVTYSYDLEGRLLSHSTPVVTGDPSSGTFSLGYDTAGRMVSETNPQSQVTSYQLDANGNHTKITYPSGYYATYVYDQLDRLTDIKLNGATTSAVTFGYDQLSRRTSKNYANGANTSYTYDLGNNLLTLNIAFVGSAANWTYTYNKVHQMLTQNCSDTTYLWRPTVGTVTYAAANNLNQYPTIGGLAATYNNQGGLATYNSWTYGYNTEGMLKTASKTGTSASFVYDGSLRQIQKTVGSVKTKYVYSGSHMMEEYDGTAGTLNTRYVFAGAEEPVLQMNSAGTVTYIHHDHHDSVIAQSGSTGAVGNKYNYGPFGESGSLTGTTIGYTGQRFDSETGLYHYKARFYLPSIGRFLQADPIGYTAGMNLYAYVGNDPMDHTDPEGLEPDHFVYHSGLADAVSAGFAGTSAMNEHVRNKLMDSYKIFPKPNSPDQTFSNIHNAVRHAAFSAYLTNRVGSRAARVLGMAHEVGDTIGKGTFLVFGGAFEVAKQSLRNPKITGDLIKRGMNAVDQQMKLEKEESRIDRANNRHGRDVAEKMKGSSYASMEDKIFRDAVNSSKVRKTGQF